MQIEEETNPSITFYAYCFFCPLHISRPCSDVSQVLRLNGEVNIRLRIFLSEFSVQMSLRIEIMRYCEDYALGKKILFYIFSETVILKC